MIKEIARDSILPLKLVPDKDVWIDHIHPHWDGKPRIYITSEPTQPEDASQFGTATATTVMAIHSIAAEREKAEALENKAVAAVYQKFSELEEQRGSGVLCVTYLEHNTFQLENRADAFVSMFSFRILHKL
jgi:type IV secretory pathway TraG/TraD family ATPase VirD4